MYIPNDCRGVGGRINNTTSAPSTWLGGVGFRGTSVCTTTTLAAHDTYVGGFRVNSIGALVINAGSGTVIIAGIARTSSGATCVISSAVSGSDTFIAGMPVSNTGRLVVGTASAAPATFIVDSAGNFLVDSAGNFIVQP